MPMFADGIDGSPLSSCVLYIYSGRRLFSRLFLGATDLCECSGIATIAIVFISPMGKLARIRYYLHVF